MSPRGEVEASFGELFRAGREKAAKSLDAVVKHLGRYTVGFLSDMERGRRGPLPPREIIAAASFFGIDPGPLLKRAAQERGTFNLDVKEFSDAEFDFLSRLATLPGLNRPETYKKLGRVLEEENLRKQKKGKKRP